MEPTRYYWVALEDSVEERRMKLVRVNPHHVKKPKEQGDNSQREDDRKDPLTIARLMQERRYMTPYIVKKDHAEMRVLTEMEDDAKAAHARAWKKLLLWPDIYFQEYRGFCNSMDVKSVWKRRRFRKTLWGW